MHNDPLPSPGPSSTDEFRMPDWNARYAQDEIPWDRHSSVPALDRVLREWQIRPCRMLEMGCGTGTNAVYFARQGFEVLAFDLVPRAIEMAGAKARPLGLKIDFRVADFRRLANIGNPFPFVFDSGLYHCVRRGMLGDWLAFLERVTQPGSLWLTLTGNANERWSGDEGPPRVQASELCFELEPLFELIELRECRFEDVENPNGRHPLAWSALMRRRVPK
jgi:SAM-dependent methyltransferase